MYKLLTFESWVTRNTWYTYAKKFVERVPYMLVDRSPCTDPFFDPFAFSSERRPLISGLCRARKNFNVGDVYIYVTRIDKSILKDLGIANIINSPTYFGVAALRIKKVYNSHEEASLAFTPRRYIVNPNLTPYPPNLAFNSCGSKASPEAAVDKDSCIIFDEKRRPRIPGESSVDQWKAHYNEYYIRQRNRSLRAAECEIVSLDDKEALKLDTHIAPILTNNDWDGMQLNVQGLNLTDDVGSRLVRKIAEN